MSLPSAAGTTPAATAAAEPPLEPPVVRPRSHGLRVSPASALRVSPSSPNSGVFVLPTTIAPASRRRSTASESWSGTKSPKRAEP